MTFRMTEEELKLADKEKADKGEKEKSAKKDGSKEGFKEKIQER